MQLNELLLKPKKKRKPNKKVLKESFPSPPPQEPVDVGGTMYTPPFYSLGTVVTDINNLEICTCPNAKVARAVANLLWEHI